MYATRTWKRDGSTNMMSLEVAAKNLKSFAAAPRIRRKREEDIVEMLVRGEEIETRLAVFTLYR